MHPIDIAVVKLLCATFQSYMTYMGKLSAILKLTRIEHSFMLVIAVFSAELIAKGIPDPIALIASFITPIFISMASFAINDYYDIAVDKANRNMKRPLVSGELSKCDALYVTYICLAIGIFASMLINSYAYYIAVIFGALAMLYSYRLKQIILLGNIYIAFSMAIPFIYGNYVVSSSLSPAIILISAMIFLSGLGREIHGTVRDMRGDRLRGVTSLPRAISRTGASVIALLLYFAAIGISIYLFVYMVPFKGDAVYLVLIGIADMLLVYVSLAYLNKKTQKFYRLARNASLAAMLLALIAILAAPLTYALL